MPWSVRRELFAKEDAFRWKWLKSNNSAYKIDMYNQALSNDEPFIKDQIFRDERILLERDLKIIGEVDNSRDGLKYKSHFTGPGLPYKGVEVERHNQKDQVKTSFVYYWNRAFMPLFFPDGDDFKSQRIRNMSSKHWMDKYECEQVLGFKNANGELCGARLRGSKPSKRMFALRQDRPKLNKMLNTGHTILCHKDFAAMHIDSMNIENGMEQCGIVQEHWKFPGLKEKLVKHAQSRRKKDFDARCNATKDEKRATKKRLNEKHKNRSLRDRPYPPAAELGVHYGGHNDEVGQIFEEKESGEEESDSDSAYSSTSEEEESSDYD